VEGSETTQLRDGRQFLTEAGTPLHQFPGVWIDVRQPTGFAPLKGPAPVVVHLLNNFQLSPKGEGEKFAVLLEPAALPGSQAPVDF